MLDGVVRFPAEFAARYRAKGYWEDRSLRDTFDEVFERYVDRIAIIDREKSVTYTELNERATRLALNLFDEGLKPLDRVVVQLPNAVEFAYLYFVELSGAVACVTPDRAKDFDYCEMVERIHGAHESLRFGIILGDASRGFLSLTELIERPNKHSANDLKKISIDPEDPAVFQ
jgi:2,3-dihydroxybenzoate-AMP ligase